MDAAAKIGAMPRWRRIAREASDRAQAVTQGTLATCALARRHGHRTTQILVVDDDENTLSATHAFLTAEGYAVDVAGHGREALYDLRHGISPRVIVLDFEMPVMGGFDFRTAQRRDPSIADIPVIVCSGAPRPRDASTLEIHEWLPKPVDPVRLLTALHRYVRPSP